MPATFSYASILHAVGQVLDQIGVKNFAIKEEEEGLFIEGYDGEGQLLVQGLYDIASLYDLMSRSEERAEEEPAINASGTLHQFLADHYRELVGTAR
jgi:hypothetical protein